ncbi:MAG: VOC family protein [Salaquimonas sp.]
MSFDSRISIVTLGVKDMPAARKFYEALGWKAAGVSNENVTFFKGTGIVLGLYGHDALAEDAVISTAPQPEFRGVSLAYNCSDTAEVDAAYAHALSCGAKPVKTPDKVFWGGYSGYFADPDGHLWEVAHNPFASLDSDGHLIIEEGA